MNEQTIETNLTRLRNVAEGKAPSPSVQVMARDAADLIEELIDAYQDRVERTRELESRLDKADAQTRQARTRKAPAKPVEEGDDE